MNFFQTYTQGKRGLILLASSFFLTALIFFIWFNDSPEERVTRYQQEFLQAVADKKWSAAKGFVSPIYADRLGHNSETLLTDLRSVTRHFFALNIRSQGLLIKQTQPEQMTVTTYLTISGTGPGLTEFITQEVNKLQNPWTFSWKKTGALPWNWQVDQVDNTSLQIDAYRRGASLNQ